MTLARAEVAISILKEGFAKVTETVENLKDRHTESRSAQEKLAGKLERFVARQDQKLTEISILLALLKKDVDDLKSNAEEAKRNSSALSVEAKRNRWALLIAIVSAVLSLTSALAVAFLKKP